MTKKSVIRIMIYLYFLVSVILCGYFNNHIKQTNLKTYDFCLTINQDKDSCSGDYRFKEDWGYGDAFIESLFWPWNLSIIYFEK